MQLEDRQHLSMGNGTFTGIHRSLHVNWLCLHQKRHLLCTSGWNWRAQGGQMRSLHLAWPARQTQLSWCSFALWRLAQYQLCNSLSAWAASVHTVVTPKSGKTCFLVSEGFSWTRLNNIYWTKVCSCWSCSGLTWAWLWSFIFSFICYNAENHCLFIFVFLQPSNQELRTGFLDPLILQTEKSDNSLNHRKLKNSTCSSTATHCCSWNLG